MPEKIGDTFFMIALMLIVIFSFEAYDNYSKSQASDPFRSMTSPLIPLTNNSQLTTIDPNTIFQGRFLIWDIQKNRESIDLSNNTLQATPNDSIVTIFFITERNSIECGSYKRPNAGVLNSDFAMVDREDVKIVAIEYPSRKVIGKKEFSSSCPNSVYTTSGSRELISTDSDIIAWINSLRRNPYPS